MAYLRYAPEIEEIAEDEAETFQKIADTFVQMGQKVQAEEGHALRVSHAKATALLTGELIVEDGLPPELAQGLAAKPCRYPVLVRFAQGPGEQLDDKISTHRGMSVKVLGLDGPVIPESDEGTSQDFVLEGSGRAFINADAKKFLMNLKAGVSHAPSISEGVKNVVSKMARGTEAVLEAVGLESKMLGFFGHPSVHPLSESYFSQAPMRWGDYVGKVSFHPTTATQQNLGEVKIDPDGDENAFRTAMQAHFAVNGAEFDLQVQLATDLKTTPIENAATEWPDTDNPYRRVARLTIPAQPAWSAARDAYFERASFRPAHSLAAHRPLGQVMRARLFVYERLVAFRQRANGETPAVPPRVEDVPG